MKVLHICVTGPFSDGWNYQENILTKYHSLLGHEVSILTTEWSWGVDGKLSRVPCERYTNDDNVEIYRLPIQRDKGIFYRYKRISNFYNTIVEIAPDIIFVHNIQFLDIDQILTYVKINRVKLYIDNHADFSNSARSIQAKLFYKIIWRYYAKKIEPYTTKFYGVLPSRVDFLKDIYGLPSEKCELLLMGGDDIRVEQAKNPKLKKQIRKKYGITDEDFFIVTGGKIDLFKTQTLLLMKAIQEIPNENVKLIVFGTVVDELKAQLQNLCDGKKIQFIGWVNSNDSYDYFAAADLVVFPGRHSVFWEQVAAQGIPMVCKYWEGTNHIDVGGNVKFLYQDSVKEIIDVISEIVEDYNNYEAMKESAVKGAFNFSYRFIAESSISSGG